MWYWSELSAWSQSSGALGDPVSVSSSTNFLLRLDWASGTRALALAEATALLGPFEIVAPGLISTGSEFLAREFVQRSAFVLSGGEIVAAGPPYRATSFELGAKDTVSVARGPWKQSGNPVDFLEGLGWASRRGWPRGSLELYADPTCWRVVRRWPIEAFQRPRLVHHYSTSLPSQIARAIVNLTAAPGQRFLDPVCGAGTILTEAIRIGCTVNGTDLNPKACHHARNNLRSLGYSGQVHHADARLETAREFDAMAGDLPYGRGLETVDLHPLLEVLPGRATRWALVASKDLSDSLSGYGHAPRTVIEVPKPAFSRFVHFGGPAPCPATPTT